MRGVYVPTRTMTFLLDGSSPHARGLPQYAETKTYKGRIIPACAGFTELLTPRERGCPDHPRMRGVYAPSVAAGGAQFGSSPHARGLLWCPPLRRGIMGIIPACAGFTTRSNFGC